MYMLPYFYFLHNFIVSDAMLDNDYGANPLVLSTMQCVFKVTG